MELFDLGAVAVLLAALGGAWWIIRVAERRGVDLTGLEALAAGIAAGPYGLKVVTQQSLTDLGPAMSFAFGALGLMIGLRLSLDDIRERPKQSMRISVILCVVTGLVVWLGAQALLEWLFGVGDTGAAAAVLATAAVFSTPNTVDAVVRRHGASGPVTRLLRGVSELSEVIGIFAFGLVVCIFHDPAAIADGRVLVAVEWAGIAIVLGVTVGLLFAWFLGPEPGPGLTVAILGMVLFQSGAAHALQLSPLMVGMVSGAVLANASPASKSLRETLQTLEKPLLGVVIFFAATAWRVPPVGAWMLVCGYVMLRLVGRWMGGGAAHYSCSRGELDPPVARLGISLLGQGGLVVAVALGAWQIFDDALSGTVLTCIVVGAFLNEMPSWWLVRNLLVDSAEVPLHEAQKHTEAHGDRQAESGGEPPVEEITP